MSGNRVAVRFDRCRSCRKIRYVRRADAKRAKRRVHPGEDLHVYPCPTEVGFHLGHLPADVVAGIVTREEVYG